MGYMPLVCCQKRLVRLIGWEGAFAASSTALFQFPTPRALTANWAPSPILAVYRVLSGPRFPLLCRASDRLLPLPL